MKKKPKKNPNNEINGEEIETLLQMDYEQAQQAFGDAARLRPDHSLHWYYLGLCQYRRGQTEDAAESLVASSKRIPRILEYELLTVFYLYGCFQQLGHEAQLVLATKS